MMINKQYFLLGEPLSGGMAEIYKAVDSKNDGKLVAIKIFKHGELKEEIIKESFRRETHALKELKHPNIVELIDSGVDKEIEHYFLVLEWLDKSLSEVLLKTPITEWNEFWTGIALPLLEALNFSHGRQCVHRDIKPSNILIAADGTVKLADFGISKLKSYFIPTITLENYFSYSYTPPEQDDGSYTYSRDVFSFGILVLECLTEIKIKNHREDVKGALEALTVPNSIYEILERCVSLDPVERPHNAQVLLAELQSKQSLLQQVNQKKRKIYLQLSNTSLANLKNELDSISETEIKKMLLDDLNEGCGIEKNNGDKKKYSISAIRHRYLVTIDDGGYIFIINVQIFSSYQLERNRERSFPLNSFYDFDFNKPAYFSSETQETLHDLQNRIEEYAANLKQARLEEEKQKIFRIWGQILSAKSDWEKKRKESIKYKSFQRDGKRLTFTLITIPDEDISGQSWSVKDKDYTLVSGDIEDIKEDKLNFIITQGDSEKLPASGELCFDIHAAEISLKRQKNALDAIRFDRVPSTDLRHLLALPHEASQPQIINDISFINPNLNASQKEVVIAALGTSSFLLVEGPPGTGKTTFITELILQTIKEKPDAKILLSSQTHVALDNALERILLNEKNVKLLRIGHHERVSNTVHSLLIDNQMHQWREDVLRSAKSFLELWAENQGISKTDIEKATLFQDLKNYKIEIQNFSKEIEICKQEFDEALGKSVEIEYYLKNKHQFDRKQQGEAELSIQRINDLNAKKRELVSIRKEMESRLQALIKGSKKQIQKLSVEDLDFKIKELFDANSVDSDKLQKMLSIQAEWIEQFGNSDLFNNALIKRAQVIAGTCIGIPGYIQDIEFDICIIDEASKANATEVLVPIALAKKWVLVGDPKQLPPFLDEIGQNIQFLDNYELKLDDVKRTLFDHLSASLPEENRKLLTVQHRMIKAIGDMVSHCFYDSKLQSANNSTYELSTVFPKPVTWFSTSNLPDKSEQNSNNSYINSCEVSVILKLLKQLNSTAKVLQNKYKVAVLTGYSAQLKQLNRMKNSHNNEFDFLDIECNTVDAFQGREADITIYSITRSNDKGKAGFLKDERRLNVAFSRSQLALAIIGDHDFCIKSESKIRDVIAYIDKHPQDCFRKEI